MIWLELWAKAGRGDESSKPLDEAEAIAREVKNDALMAKILNTRGDVAFYRGDIKGADQFYKSALRTGVPMPRTMTRLCCRS